MASKKGRGARKAARRRLQNKARTQLCTALSVHAPVAGLQVSPPPPVYWQPPSEADDNEPIIERSSTDSQCLRRVVNPPTERDWRRARELINQKTFEKAIEHCFLSYYISYDALLGLRSARSFYAFLRVHEPRFDPRAVEILRGPTVYGGDQNRDYLWQKDKTGISITSFGHAWWELFCRERKNSTSIIQRLIREWSPDSIAEARSSRYLASEWYTKMYGSPSHVALFPVSRRLSDLVPSARTLRPYEVICSTLDLS